MRELHAIWHFPMLFILFCAYFTLVQCTTPWSSLSAHNTALSQEESLEQRRPRRQFDFTLSAEHDEKAEETEIALEAIANLWRSQDGNTQVEGSAKVVHRSNSLESGNTRYSAHLHVHRNYK